MSNYFSSNLKYLREKKKLSQNKFAEMIGVNQTTVARWEDDNRTPNLDNAIDVSNALNIPLPDLVGRDLRIEDSIPKNDNDYKKILQDKGLMDENENIDKEKIDDLLRVAEMMKKFNEK